MRSSANPHWVSLAKPGRAGDEMSEDLRLWLQSIGLEQLADTFAANDIDLEILPDLSDEDLKELGLSLGHRRRLLRAIAELPRERTPPAAEIAESSTDTG